MAAADVTKSEVASAAKADTARIAEDHRRKGAEGVGIVPVAALLRPNVVVAVPSSWRQLTAPEKSSRASVATAVAYQVVEEDVTWTSEAEEAEGCLPVGKHQTVVVVRAVEADDPSVGQG